MPSGHLDLPKRKCTRPVFSIIIATRKHTNHEKNTTTIAITITIKSKKQATKILCLVCPFVDMSVRPI